MVFNFSLTLQQIVEYGLVSISYLGFIILHFSYKGED